MQFIIFDFVIFFLQFNINKNVRFLKRRSGFLSHIYYIVKIYITLLILNKVF